MAATHVVGLTDAVLTELGAEFNMDAAGFRQRLEGGEPPARMLPPSLCLFSGSSCYTSALRHAVWLCRNPLLPDVWRTHEWALCSHLVLHLTSVCASQDQMGGRASPMASRGSASKTSRRSLSS